MTSAMRWMWVGLVLAACGSDVGEPTMMDRAPLPDVEETLHADDVRLPVRVLAPSEPMDGCALVLVASDGRERYVSESLLERGDDGLVRDEGDFMLAGYALDGYGHASCHHGPLALLDELAPLVTTQVGVRVNLNANEERRGDFDPANPAETANFSSGFTVYDARGYQRIMTIFWRKARTQAWSWHALWGWDNPSGFEYARGTVEFDGVGRLVKQTTGRSALPIGLDDEELPVRFDFEGTTGTYDPSSSNAVHYDGRAGSMLIEHDVDSSGLVRAITSVGTREPMGTLAFAFGNERDGYEVLPVDSTACTLSRSFVDDGVFDLRVELP